ncbi:hypothetical protein CAEBREN_20032 [Caenorhabditis brenneri]|uniref:Metalloendopeptidase n=1 Tax=Caenorhabditis brenneri TaxID=135651 RepID=G0MAK1_CAEBE|nr:hypothetical protein CAEBREN_20032 [Caenorhabditis brenneri]
MDCWARLGKEGTTPQEISIDVNCESLGTVTHEIAHAFGFVHEHKHFERDDYIIVQYENINSTQWFNFDIELESTVEDFGIGYDYGSVMHYRGNSFTKNKNLTILTVDPNYQDTIGQEVGPSFADVKKLNFAYCNSTCPNTLNCERGGYVDPNNCNRCKCPEGFGGQLCEKVAVNIKACGASNLTATRSTQVIKAAGAKTCYYLIKAPTNKRVFFNLIKKAFPNYWQCSGGYVEINYNGDFKLTGARYCFYEPTVSQSKHEELLVIYKGAEDSEFALSYRYDDPSTASRVNNIEKTGCAIPKKMEKN